MSLIDVASGRAGGSIGGFGFTRASGCDNCVVPIIKYYDVEIGPIISVFPGGRVRRADGERRRRESGDEVLHPDRRSTFTSSFSYVCVPSISNGYILSFSHENAGSGAPPCGYKTNTFESLTQPTASCGLSDDPTAPLYGTPSFETDTAPDNAR